MFHEHVKEYKLAFSDNDSNYQVYQENGKDRVSFSVRSLCLILVHKIPLEFSSGVSVFRSHENIETYFCSKIETSK